ncbi:PITH domain-containing protein 1 [Cyclospora cayetanensis]|uniref:PITH domain-containing protein 1 n=1 Tax=Cyclospora cayetanensis TaxID=88456 RepID=A0A6P6RX98_9EIME|nr:PITH domain-containing protein 1 [Cyclospora cayetanensis]
MPGVHGEGCGCKAETELTIGEFLYGYIDREGVRGVNEQERGSAKKVIKTYDERLDDSLSCKSEQDDSELISSLIVIGGGEGRAPGKVKVFANREDLDFTNVRETECVQEIDLTEDFHGAVEYPLKVTKLQNVSSLALYFPENFGGDCTEIVYIGLRGVGSKYQRRAVQTVYEAQPNLKDHKQPGDQFTPQMGL